MTYYLCASPYVALALYRLTGDAMAHHNVTHRVKLVNRIRIMKLAKSKKG